MACGDDRREPWQWHWSRWARRTGSPVALSLQVAAGALTCDLLARVCHRRCLGGAPNGLINSKPALAVSLRKLSRRWLTLTRANEIVHHLPPAKAAVVSPRRFRAAVMTDANAAVWRNGHGE